MKSTGIVRKVDELGRIVLPIELRRTLDIAERDPLEIIVDGEKTEVTAKSYNVKFDDLSNSHFVRVNCKKVTEKVEEAATEVDEFPIVVVWIAMGVLVVIAAVVVTLILLKEKKKNQMKGMKDNEEKK